MDTKYESLEARLERFMINENSILEKMTIL